MTTPLPPDPYSALGVSKSSTLAEIRSAHRKLVIKCHPDKVQDPALKAIKQDEFHSVQQAYELLSDDNRRREYDSLLRLDELKRELGRSSSSGPTPQSKEPASRGMNPFDYQERDYYVRTAEPRNDAYFDRERSKPFYSTSSRSYEDDLPRGAMVADENFRQKAKKSKSYDDAPRSKSAKDRDEDRRRERRAEEEKIKAKEEKKRRAAAEQKTRDKERRSGKEDKYRSTRTHYVSASEEDDYHDKAARARRKTGTDARVTEERAGDIPPAAASRDTRSHDDSEPDGTRKLRLKEYIAQKYLHDSKAKSRKAADHVAEEPRSSPTRRPDAYADSRPMPGRRAETYHDMHPKYTTEPHSFEDDDEVVPRSRATRQARRPSEQAPGFQEAIPMRPSARDKSAPSYEPRAAEAEPYRTTSSRTPSMPLHHSSPANLENMIPSRKEPHRSRTMPTVERAERDTTRSSLHRSATFDGNSPTTKSAARGTGSKLRTETLVFSSDEDEPERAKSTPRRGASPPPTSKPRRPHLQPVSSYSYKVGPAGIVPGPASPRHREHFRHDDDYARDSSTSPRTPRPSPVDSRPSLHRSDASRQTSSSRSVPQWHENPIIKESGRPRMSTRESSSRSERYNDVQYTSYEIPTYSPDYSRRHVDATGHAGISPDHGYQRTRPTGRA